MRKADLKKIAAARGLDRSATHRRLKAISKRARRRFPQARAELSGKLDRVDLVPESVAQSVLVGELGQLPDLEINDDEHLVGRMRLAIRNKIRTRLRKGGKAGQPVQMSQCPSDRSDVGVAGGPGPATSVEAVDESVIVSRKSAALRARLFEGEDQQSQQMIEMCVFRGLDAKRAAEHIGCSHDALRARLSRSKKPLRAKLLEPVREVVQPQEWAILSGVLVEQMSPAKLTGVLGMSAEELADSFEGLLSGVVLEQLGPEGMEVLHRLLGRMKK